MKLTETNEFIISFLLFDDMIIFKPSLYERFGYVYEDIIFNGKIFLIYS